MPFGKCQSMLTALGVILLLFGSLGCGGKSGDEGTSTGNGEEADNGSKGSPFETWNQDRTPCGLDLTVDGQSYELVLWIDDDDLGERGGEGGCYRLQQDRIRATFSCQLLVPPGTLISDQVWLFIHTNGLAPGVYEDFEENQRVFEAFNVRQDGEESDIRSDFDTHADIDKFYVKVHEANSETGEFHVDFDVHFEWEGKEIAVEGTFHHMLNQCGGG